MVPVRSPLECVQDHLSESSIRIDAHGRVAFPSRRHCRIWLTREAARDSFSEVPANLPPLSRVFRIISIDLIGNSCWCSRAAHSELPASVDISRPIAREFWLDAPGVTALVGGIDPGVDVKTWDLRLANLGLWEMGSPMN
jgi:hypothetical protein